jgi:hypothetical protein
MDRFILFALAAASEAIAQAGHARLWRRECQSILIEVHLFFVPSGGNLRSQLLGRYHKIQPQCPLHFESYRNAVLPRKAAWARS